MSRIFESRSRQLGSVVVENIPSSHFLINEKKFKTLRSQSPLSTESDDREAIYLSLLKPDTQFSEEKIFKNSPEFFKRKIGLVTTPPTSHYCKNEDESNRRAAKRHIPPHERYKYVNNKESNLSDKSSSYSMHSDNSSTYSDAQSLSNKSSFTNSQSSNSTIWSYRKPEWSNNFMKSNSSSTNNFWNCSDIVSEKERTKSQASILRKAKLIHDENFKNEIHEEAESSDVEIIEKFVRKGNKKKTNTKLKGSMEEKENRKQIEQYVFAINGSLVAFKGFGSENCLNWFATYEGSRINMRRKKRTFMELDFTGFSDKEISMKLIDNKILMIEGRRERGKKIEKKLKKKIILPENVSIDSLLLSRTNDGFLIIEKTVS